MIASSKTGAVTFYLCLTLSVLAVFVISANSLLNLPYYWGKEEYSHGYLIPLIAIFLGWHSLSRARLEAEPSWLGIPVLLFSFFMSVISELAAFEAFLNYSFILSFFGISLSFFGKKITWALTPSLIFLGFAAPLPHIVHGNLSLRMQLMSSTLGTQMIDIFGFSVFQDGNIIDLGHMKLQVAEACNGLRYLFPLMSLGYLIACLIEVKWWQRVLVFLSVVPITIIMNSIRIGTIGITVNLWGQDMAEGVLHAFEGYVVFGICLLFLMVEVGLLLHFSPSARFHDEYLTLPKGWIQNGTPKLSAQSGLALILSLAMVVLFYTGGIKNRVENTPQTPSLSGFPSQIEKWTGHQGHLSAEEIKVLDLTDYWMADYNKFESPSPVNFYVAYYNSQRMRANIHIPLNCIIGGGWKVTGQSTIVVDTSAGKVPLVRMVIEKQGQITVVYYWLEQRGRRINSPLWAKIYLVWDSIVLHRTDGALVRVTTPLASGETQQNADDRLHEFIQSIYPAVKEFIPGR